MTDTRRSPSDSTKPGLALRLSAVALATLGIGALTACGSTSASSVPSGGAASAATTGPSPETASDGPSIPPASPSSPVTNASPAPGRFIDYASYASAPGQFSADDVVLFFNASWCPTCQEATRNLEDSAIPAGLTVVSVDYDSSQELRAKYGVTVQHTFVQISPDGSELAKWSGSTNAEQIESKVV